MADTTSLAESSQALFCALAEFIISRNDRLEFLFDKTQIKSFDMFKQVWAQYYKNKEIKEIFTQHTDTPKVSYEVLDKFLTDNIDWYISSLAIAKKLVEDIDTVSRNFKGIKKPNPTQIWFVRGDKPIMDNILKLFSEANQTQIELNKVEGVKRGVVFRDINKWSPADIYFSSDNARRKIDNELMSSKKGAYSFMDLNVLISDLIDSGELLPLSLKKTTKEVHLQKVNFDRPAEIKAIKEYGFVKCSDWKKYEINRPQTRDVKIYMNHKTKDHIKFKHDASTNALKAEFQISGAEARGGSIASLNGIVELIEMVDPQFASRFKKIGSEALTEFKDKMKDLGTKPPKASKEKDAWDKVRAVNSALYVSNAIFPSLIKWLNAHQEKSDKFVRILYAYITSRTEESSKFVIAK